MEGVQRVRECLLSANPHLVSPPGWGKGCQEWGASALGPRHPEADWSLRHFSGLTSDGGAWEVIPLRKGTPGKFHYVDASCPYLIITKAGFLTFDTKTDRWSGFDLGCLASPPGKLLSLACMIIEFHGWTRPHTSQLGMCTGSEIFSGVDL